MSVVVVGLHERDASLDLLEQLAVPDRELAKTLRTLCDSPHLSEAVVLSTCMRTEVYAVLERFHDGLEDIQAFFQGRVGDSQSGAATLAEQLFVAYDDAAARHLFEVAAGIDSAVLGEGEILRQVRHASERSRHERAAGPVLGGLFRHAVEVGKRARTETTIARGVTSLAHVAVALVAERHGQDLSGLRVVVVGAGEMGQGVLGALARVGGSPEVVVANRGRARAAQLAAEAGARAVDLARLPAELAGADVVVTGTAAGEILLGPDEVAAALGQRPERPLLVVDVAVPRDVDPAVGRLPGVTLLDLDDLTRYAESGMAARRSEVGRVRQIVEEELERYRADALGRSVAPLVASLRARGEELRLAELEHSSSTLEALEPAARDAVEQMTRRLVAKLLHPPTVQVKSAAGSPRGERLAEALRSLFEL
ncbi:MAG TPA: glutamyl-tRNA reductase [Acidimicrobiales bacterium]|nr:glutamyl-tRNA reductase [Acidimicrobiales bacterium]